MNKKEENTQIESLCIEASTPCKVAYRLSAPAIVCGVILITLSCIIDFIYTSGTSTLGESTLVSAVLFGVGNLAVNTAFILISVGIAFAKSGLEATIAAICGALIAVKGSTFTNASGSMTGIPGIFGCILLGYLAGYCTNFCKRFFKNTENILTFIVPIIATCTAALIIGSVSQTANSVATTFISALADSKTFLLPIVIGIFTVIDAGGPLHLCAYIFGVSSIAAGEPQVMAAVLAAGMIPPLTIGLFSYIYKDRLEKAERSAAYIGIIPALLGLPQVSYPIYVSRGYKVLLPFIAGSSVSSALSMLLGCTAKVPIGGLLTFESSGKPLYLLLSVISGVIVSTIIMTVTIKGESKAKERESDEIIDILPNTAKAKSHP